MSTLFDKNFGIMSKDTFKKLQTLTIMIVGLGGLGGHVANNLVRLGVRKLILVDPDVFEITNLNRQLFSSQDVIGKPKTEVIADALRKINPEVEILTYQKRVQSLDKSSFKGLDLLVDAVDNIQTKCDIETLGTIYDIPLLHGAIAGWYGQLGLIMPNTHLLRDLYSNENQGLEKTLGSPTFTPAVIAGIMTSECLKYFNQKEDALINQIMMVDLYHLDFQVLYNHHGSVDEV